MGARIPSNRGHMKLHTKLYSSSRPLLWSQLVLFTISVSMIAYCCFVLLDRRMLQQSRQTQFRNPISTYGTNPVWANKVFGRIEIPSLGISALVVEGTSPSALRHAVAHIEGTGWPGLPGNIGLSANQDSFFRPLRNIRKDDVINITNSLASFQYRVVSTRVVLPTDAAVPASSSQEILTLVTFYPFYFIGPTPSRFIVRAERIDERKLQPSECLSCFTDAIHDSLRARATAPAQPVRHSPVVMALR